MKKSSKGRKRILVLFFLFLFMIQGSLFVANAEGSLPNPSLPNPSLSDPDLSNSILPGTDVDSLNNGINPDGSSNSDNNKGWVDSLSDLFNSVRDNLDSFSQQINDTIMEVGRSIFTPPGTD